MYMWQRHVWYLYEKLCSWDIFRLLRPKSSVQFMGTLWRYDLKTKNGSFSACNCHFFTQNQMLYLYWKFSAIGLLSFHFLTPTRSEQFKGTLWPQNWNKTRFFFLVTVSFPHRDSGVRLQLKAVTYDFISPSYTDKLWEICEDVMIKTKLENLMIFTVLCAVSFTFSVLSGFSLKLQTNQSVLTFKVKGKFEVNFLTIVCNCSPLVLFPAVLTPLLSRISNHSCEEQWRYWKSLS